MKKDYRGMFWCLNNRIYGGSSNVQEKDIWGTSPDEGKYFNKSRFARIFGGKNFCYTRTIEQHEVLSPTESSRYAKTLI